MQKWEYLTVTAERGSPSLEPKVHYVNYQRVEGEEKRGFLSSTIVYPGMRKYLAHLGGQGWELVSVLHIGDYEYDHVFKRPRR